jgi:hypothetical protein
MSRMWEPRESANDRIDGGPLLRPGDLIPRFDAATVDGREVPYEQVWQHRNVVLFVVSADVNAAASPYLSALKEKPSKQRGGADTAPALH